MSKYPLGKIFWRKFKGRNNFFAAHVHILQFRHTRNFEILHIKIVHGLGRSSLGSKMPKHFWSTNFNFICSFCFQNDTASTAMAATTYKNNKLHMPLQMSLVNGIRLLIV